MPKWPPTRAAVSLDLNLLLVLQYIRRRLPGFLRRTTDRLISAHPLHDLSLLVWAGAGISLWFVGWQMAWMVAGNATLSFVLASLLPLTADAMTQSRGLGFTSLRSILNATGRALAHLSRTPEQYDGRLKPRGRVSPSGFPCIELHILTVMWATLIASPWTRPAGDAGATAGLALGAIVSIAGLVALRMYAGTHMLWQLAASIALGALTAPVQLRLAARAFPKAINPLMHSLNFFLLALTWAGYVAYQAESNASPFLRVERSECEWLAG